MHKAKANFQWKGVGANWQLHLLPIQNIVIIIHDVCIGNLLLLAKQTKLVVQ